MMEAYTDFASVYDVMMSNIPYSEWAEYAKELLEDEGFKAGATIAEVGCGTGSFMMEMDKLGYKVSGFDLSPDMLAVAKKKFEEAGKEEVVFGEQDMRELDLPEKTDVILCVCDSINYILEPEDLAKTFRAFEKNLKSNGVVILDLKTKDFYENVLAYNTMAENFENCSYIWDNYYHEDERINEYVLTIYAREGKFYRRFEENHFQKAYEVDEVAELARQNGFTNIKIYDAFSKDKPSKKSERVYFVLKR